MSKTKSATLAAAIIGLAATPALLVATPATAASHHHHASRAGVHFANGASHPRHQARGGEQRLVSDGPGTGFGFHHAPTAYRVGNLRYRNRQADAVHEAVDDDALTSGGYYGFPGDSVYGAGGRAAYGVFNGADGYGSPYFAGFYGPADGTDYGPFGHAYDD